MTAFVSLIHEGYEIVYAEPGAPADRGRAISLSNSNVQRAAPAAEPGRSADSLR